MSKIGLDLGSFRGAPARPGAAPLPRSGGDVGALVHRERRAKEIIAGIDDLPSLPTVVTHVLRMANDPNTNACDFESVVRNDQALASRVLKLVNSSFFGLPKRLSSISQAIVIIGFKTLRSIILAASTTHILDGQLGRYGIEPGGLWRHSVGAAALARFFALRLGLGAEKAEELFVAGLLHDMGKIALAPHLEKIDGNLRGRTAEKEGDLVAAEEDLVGISHAAAGAIMAEKWNLATNLVDWIRRHHDPIEDGEGKERLVLRLADDGCNRRGLGLSDDFPHRADRYEEMIETAGLAGNDEEIEGSVVKALENLDSVLRAVEGV
ncbi:MAG: HDOD domain-containing protein [Candidatus Eisenbacteria bacterium]